VDQYVEAGFGSMINHMLPPDVRACLLTIARRRGVLTDDVLLSLVDDTWSTLDIAKPFSRPVPRQPEWLSDGAIRKAVCSIGENLQALDISACDSLTSAGIKQIAQACPKLRLLRLGGSPRSNAVAADMVPKLIPPPLLQRGSKPADDWEELKLDDEAVTEPGVDTYIPCLKFLVWPSIPAAINERVKSTTSMSDPVLLNPDPKAPAPPNATRASKAAAALQALKAQGPSPLDPAVPLDEWLAHTVHASSWEGAPKSAPGQAVTMHTRFARRAERRRIRKLCSTDVKAKAAAAASAGSGVTVRVDAARAAAAAAAAAAESDDEVDTEEEAEELPPITQRFAQAYIDQARRIREVSTRDAVREGLRAERRALRSSPALQVVARWLDDY